MSRFRTPAAFPPLLPALLLLGASTGAVAAQLSHDQSIPVLNVNGSAEVSVEPDEAVVRLGVESEAEDAAAAQDATNRTAQAILDAVQGLGVGERAILTSALRLHPVYDQPAPRSTGRTAPVVVAYRATNEVTVRLDDLGKIGPVIDVSVAAGANRVLGVDFGLKDDLAARRAALSKAIAEARAKADTMAEALGVPLGPVLEVNEGGVSVQPVRFAAAQMMRMEAAQAAPTPVSAGDVTVSASVQIRFRLGDG